MFLFPLTKVSICHDKFSAAGVSSRLALRRADGSCPVQRQEKINVPDQTVRQQQFSIT
jgi:hypothetical protein